MLKIIQIGVNKFSFLSLNTGDFCEKIWFNQESKNKFEPKQKAIYRNTAGYCS